MTKKELLDKLKACSENGDIEIGHVDADNALLEFINDPEITEAFNSWGKWYA
jgi:predicted glycosyl hydrolase (DUF1957 family)